MNPTVLISKLKESKTLDNAVQKYTLIVNDKSEEQGALFFIPVGGKEFKVLVPAPFHKDLIQEDQVASYNKVLNHKEAAILK